MRWGPLCGKNSFSFLFSLFSPPSDQILAITGHQHCTFQYKPAIPKPEDEVETGWARWAGSGDSWRAARTDTVNTGKENRNNQTREPLSCYCWGKNNEWVKMDTWSSLLKQEAVEDDCLEVSSRCFHRMMGVKQEAALPHPEIDKLGKDWQETEGRRRLTLLTLLECHQITEILKTVI